jgi:hypothetical protein
MVTILRRNVPVVCGASYHLLGYRILQESKIRFRLQVKSYISNWLFSESRLLASYVSRHKAMAYDTIRSLTKSCKTCQVNKKWGHLPSKTIITVPWRALCVDLIGPYTLKGKDGTIIDFMALTMIDPTTRCFKVVELNFSPSTKNYKS